MGLLNIDKVLELISQTQCNIEIETIRKIVIADQSQFRSYIQGDQQRNVKIVFDTQIACCKNKESAIRGKRAAGAGNRFKINITQSTAKAIEPVESAIDGVYPLINARQFKGIIAAAVPPTQIDLQSVELLYFTLVRYLGSKTIAVP